MANDTLPSVETMYRACVERDTQYEGVFFTAVKTTGIFCRPSCHARKPRRENVEFFATVYDALAHGYRPCRVCHPLEPYGATPDWVRSALRKVGTDSVSAPSDDSLRKLGIDPARLRRWFKRHYGMTFRAYARLLRINSAYGNIRNGGTVTDAAFAHGYESISGFTDSFKKAAGFAPASSATAAMITVSRILTPLGPMMAGATDSGVCLLEFADRRMLERQLEILRRRFRARTVPGSHPLFDELETELAEYFQGERRSFAVQLDLRGTPFQRAAWNELLTIPYGETRSYGEQARRMGNGKAVRAVGRANGENRIAILVPCHRVVGADGALTGYGGGVWRKRALLELERTN